MKKGEVTTMNVVIGIILLVIVAIVVLAVFRNIFGEEVKQTDDLVRTTGARMDNDNDGVYDLFDRCPCTGTYPAGTWKDTDAWGCGTNGEENEKSSYDEPAKISCKKEIQKKLNEKVE